MNGIHDMGGMHGHGPIAPEDEKHEPLWHAPWEARMLGITRSMTYPKGFNIDRFRHIRELMPPALYLARSYYDHWYAVCVAALLNGGLATKEEIKSGHAAAGSAKRNDAARADQVWQSQKTQGVFTREVTTPPLFAIGQRVRARNINPTGHTRCRATCAAKSAWCKSTMAATSSPTPMPICRGRRRSTSILSLSRRANCGAPMLPRAMRSAPICGRAILTQHSHAHDHDHGLVHHHDIHSELPSDPALRVKALESLLTEKGLVDPAAIDAWIEIYESKIGPRNGAKVVAKAWVDPAYKQRLLSDGSRAIGELDFLGRQGQHIVAVENTPEVHNLVVCTLCSCYPLSVLGLPPAWYKSAPYRSRAVIDPRGVLKEFGLELPEHVKIRVWDSTAEVRYLVLPERPAGTEGMSEEQLAALVTRDSMIGVGRVSAK